MKKTLSAAFLFLALCVATTAVINMRIESKAKFTLAELSKLRPGVSPRSQVEEIARECPSCLWKQACTDEKCVYAFQFQNSVLSKLRISPKTSFSGTVEVDSERVTQKHLVMAQRLGTFLVSVFDVGCYPCDAAQRPYFKHRVGWATTIILTPASSEEQRRQGHEFNLSALNHIGPESEYWAFMPSAKDELPAIK